MDAGRAESHKQDTQEDGLMDTKDVKDLSMMILLHRIFHRRHLH